MIDSLEIDMVNAPNVIILLYTMFMPKNAKILSAIEILNLIGKHINVCANIT